MRLQRNVYTPFGFLTGQSGALWHAGKLRPLCYAQNDRLLIDHLHKFYTYEKPFLNMFVDLVKTSNLSTGRLANTLPGAGKRRLFIIGNYIVQRLLQPIHAWAMRVLSRLPCDGTYDQSRPIYRLQKYKPKRVTSFDLSSATDRWPVAFIYHVMSHIFGAKAGDWFVYGTLSANVFSVNPPLVKREKLLYFKTGQPLGYYGSWALFSLSHHILVWMAARFEYPKSKRPFKRYALLGDDIVIADVNVARRYKEFLNRLGVQI